MMNKQELVDKAIGFQDEINHLLLKHRPETWLSLNLTMVQLKSIIYISDKGKANFKELAEALNVKPSVVTGIVDRLISQGMLKRRHLGSLPDRRVQWLTITNKGKNLLENIREQMGEGMSQILVTMSDKDLSALVQGFSALVESVRLYIKKQSEAAETADNRDGP